MKTFLHNLTYTTGKASCLLLVERSPRERNVSLWRSKRLAQDLQCHLPVQRR